MIKIYNMRAKEAARYLGVGLSTVWLYAKQGKITPIKLSDKVTLFQQEDLDRFINSRAESETAETNTPYNK